MKMAKNGFTTIVLCCYAVFLLFLLTSGNIRKLINPKLSFLSIISLVIIGAMILHNFAKVTGRQGHAQSKHSSSSPCCHHPEDENEESHVHASNYLLFLPLVLSVLFPPGIIGYQTATGMNVSGASPSTQNIYQNQTVLNQSSQQSLPPSQAILSPVSGGVNANPDGNSRNTAGYTVNPSRDDAQDLLEQFVPAGFREYTQIDIGNTIFNGNKQTKEEMTHDKIFLKGKILESRDIPENELVLYRMVITCCAADAMAVGVTIQLPSSEAIKFKPNEWVAVEGTLQLKPFDQRLQNVDPITVMVPPEKIYPVLTASRIYKVQPPRDEYLYP